VRRLDTSVGQRLAIGAAAVAVLVATLVVVAFVLSSRVHTLVSRQAETIAPRAALAEELERSILYVAVAARSYAFSQAVRDLETLSAATAGVQASTRRLAQMPHSGDEQRLVTDIALGEGEYREAVRSFVSRVSGGESPDSVRGAELALADRRERALTTVRAYGALQTQKLAAGGREIQAATSYAATALAVLGGLVLLASGAAASLGARSVRVPAVRLGAAAHALSAGDYGPALALEERPQGPASSAAFRDEVREAGNVFGWMARALKRREDRLLAQMRLSDTLATTLEVPRLAGEALREVAAHVGAEVGVVYLRANGTGALARLADFGLNGAAADAVEGLPRQAAADRRTYVVRDIPPDTPFTIRLGVDAAPPRCVAASPMVTRGHVLGVLVLASLRDLPEAAVEFLEHAAGTIAVSLDNALAHARIQELVRALQGSNEQLQAQNEELQAQSEELQAQSEELQGQSEELQQQNEELQRQSDVLHVQRADLEQRNRELDRAERQKNEFLAILSHELRNPLAAIVTALHLVEGQAEPGVARRAWEVVRRQARQLSRIVDDLLDITRISVGKIELQRRAVDVNAVVEGAVDSARVALRARGHELVLRRASQPIVVAADPARLEQVLGNLLDNAAKYTEPGGRIIVTIAPEDEAAVVRVRDTGIGIEPDLLPQVFEMFAQADSSLARTRGGLGLGLSLVRKLVELHGGTVEARSDGAGRGSEFVVRLPIGGGSLPAAVPEVVPLAPARALRVLIIEDNVDIADSLAVLIARRGHEVRAEHDPHRGLRLALTPPPFDLVLLDIGLPELDGYAVARRLREAVGSRTRLVAFTGYGRPEDRQRAFEAGFDDLVTKPLELDALERLLAQVAAPPAG
jgi:signal transduction histidine kinase/ActR/RegA family two-component response regulator